MLYDLADSLGVSVDYLLYPEQPDARIRNIEALLRDKPESFIIAVERLVRLCIEEFSGWNKGYCVILFAKKDIT